MGIEHPVAAVTGALPRLEPLRQVRTDALEVAYFEAGPSDGEVALLDALDIPRAILAGYDWGGRAACVAAALWPDRCAGIVSVNSYLIQDISSAMMPIRPDLEAGFWYFYYFLTERGRAGLEANRREIAR